MTWFAAAEGTPATAHDTEAEAIVAAEALTKRPVVVWEISEGDEA